LQRATCGLLATRQLLLAILRAASQCAFRDPWAPPRNLNGRQPRHRSTRNFVKLHLIVRFPATGRAPHALCIAAQIRDRAVVSRTEPPDMEIRQQVPAAVACRVYHQKQVSEVVGSVASVRRKTQKYCSLHSPDAVKFLLIDDAYRRF
jgi:hypothetical protein